MLKPLLHARQRAGSAAITAFFNGLSSLGRLHPKARPARHGLEVVRDVAYLDTRESEHLLDVYRPIDAPRDARARPVVMYVHGGGFRILSKDTHWIMALAFARRGYVVINVSYRLAPRHPFPAAVDDVCRAYQWVVQNAARFGGDPSRLVLAGESAGANLVTSLAVAACYQREEPFARAVWNTGVVPRAVLPACGIFEVERIERFRQRWPGMPTLIEDRLHEVSQAYLRNARHQSRELLELANPLHLFERGARPDRALPPFLVQCGTKDPLIDDSARLTRALTALDVPVREHVYPGEVHAFHALVFRGPARRFWGHTYSFLDEHLGPSRASVAEGQPGATSAGPSSVGASGATSSAGPA